MSGKKSDKNPFADFENDESDFFGDTSWLDDDEGGNADKAVAAKPTDSLPPVRSPLAKKTPKSDSERPEPHPTIPPTGDSSGFGSFDDDGAAGFGAFDDASAEAADDLPDDGPEPPSSPGFGTFDDGFGSFDEPAPPAPKTPEPTPPAVEVQAGFGDFGSFDDDDRDSLPVAPSPEKGASMEQISTVDPGRSATDDTIGVFLEPVSDLDTSLPHDEPDFMVTLTDETLPPMDVTDVSGDVDTATVERPRIDMDAVAAPEAETTNDDAMNVVPQSEPVTWGDEDLETIPGVSPQDGSITFNPQNDGGGWADVATLLEAAAATAEGDGAKALWVEAARVRSTYLRDSDGAKQCLVQAGELSASELDLQVELARRDDDARSLLDARLRLAEATNGAESASHFHNAAMVSYQLQDHDRARTLFQSALEADPTDYASLSYLRDLLVSEEHRAQRIQVLQAISQVASGRVAAEALFEAGRWLEHAEQFDAATEAMLAGLEADPSHTPCFLGAERLLIDHRNDEGLGNLYASEAKRLAGISNLSRDASEYAVMGARAFAAARKLDLAGEMFDLAVSLGHRRAIREYEAFASSNGMHEKAAELLRADSKPGDAGAAYGQYRLGLQLELGGQPEQALEAYRAAVDADPKAGPAAESVARILSDADRYEDLLSFWENRIERSDDAGLQSAVLLRIAEVAEARLEDADRAIQALERLLELTPQNRMALQQVRRLYQKTGRWEDLARTYETLASVSADPVVRTKYFARAGEVWHGRVQALEKAREAFGSALALDPAHAMALDGQVDVLSDLGDWTAHAQVLREAANHFVDPGERLRASYQAGLTYFEKLGDLERAREAFRFCLECEPGYLPALGLLKQIALRESDLGRLHGLYLEQAANMPASSGRHWRTWAAAELATRLPQTDHGEHVVEILDVEPNHPGALRTQEMRLLAVGATVGLVGLYRRVLPTTSGTERTDLLVQLAGLLSTLPEVEAVDEVIQEALQADETDVPWFVLGRAAEAKQLWSTASTASRRAGAPEAALDAARAQCFADPASDPSIFSDLLDEPATVVGAAFGAASLGQRAGDAAMVLRSHRLIAEHADSAPITAVHAVWAGQFAEREQSLDEALYLYKLALEARPESIEAFDGLRRVAVSLEDPKLLQWAWVERRPNWRHGLAQDLELLGDHERINQIWEEAAEGLSFDAVADLPILLRLEESRAKVGNWQGVYDLVSKRMSLLQGPALIEHAKAKRRWLLAEKLAGTQEAWDLYQAAYEEDPEDRQVLSALANIALARGDTRLAAGYLESLAADADGPEEAADLCVRRAAVFREAGETDNARQSYLDALDHVSSCRPALDGLKQVSLESEDWSGYLAALKRESHLVTGDEQVELLVLVAETTQERLEDADQAKEAWLNVLELAPERGDALRALFALAEQSKDVSSMLAHGQALVEQIDGEEQAALLVTLGRAAMGGGEPEVGVGLLERALTASVPSADAARDLVDHYRAANDTANLARLLVACAELTADESAVATLLEEAARSYANELGNPDLAVSLYERVISIDNENEEALAFVVSQGWESGNRSEGLLQAFDLLAPKIGLDADLEDFDEAQELCEFHESHAQLLKTYGRLDDAAASAAKSLEYNSFHQPAMRLRADLLIALERWGDAVRELKSMLKLAAGQRNPSLMADVYAQLGMAEHGAGDPKSAAKRFAKALQSVPNHVGALKGQAAIMEQEGKFTEVLNVYNEIIKNPGVPEDRTDAFYAKGRVLDEHLNRPDKATTHFHKSLAIDANQPKVLLRLAEISARSEDWAEVSSMAKRGISLAKAPAVLVDLFLCEAVARQAVGAEDRAGEALAAARERAGSSELAGRIPEAVDGGGLQALMTEVRGRLPK